MVNKYQFLTIESPRQLLRLAALGFWVGLLSAGLLICFRWLVESVQARFLPGGLTESYEQLPLLWVGLLPLLGGLLLGLMFQALPPHMRGVGVVHTFERLAYYGGRLPWVNVLVQFIGAAVAIICGHSVGREGPAVHMGAGAGSQIAISRHMTHEQTRTLIAAGVAAAIAASFNTPIAGVVFALEVIMLQYSIASIVPIIAASAIATIFSRFVFGDDPLLHSASSLYPGTAEMLWVAISGAVIGLLAAMFVKTLLFFTRLRQDWPIWVRMSLGGAIVSACAMVAPEVMGLGYDTVEISLNQNLAATVVLLIVVMKLLATAGCLGMGIPGGLIGPTLVMGACMGSALGGAGALLWDHMTPMQGIFAMIGMGAMMGATLRAPLAALLAVFELTHDPQLLLPAMLAIVLASMVSGHILRQRSVFRLLLQARNMDYQDGELATRLRQVPVAHIMNRHLIDVDADVTVSGLLQVLNSNPAWVLVHRDGAAPMLLPAVDVLRALYETKEQTIDLLRIPARAYDLVYIDSSSTLQQALEQMQLSQVEAACVCADKDGRQIFTGVITMEDVYAFRVRPEVELKQEGKTV